MKDEIEAKFLDVNLDAIRNKLKSIGAIKICLERLMKRIVYDNRLNPQIKGTYVRIRDEEKAVKMSLKINASEKGKISDQKELELTVSNFDDAKEFLESIGLIANAYQENLREVWTYKASEIVIDTWPLLPSYIEIESPNEKVLREISNDLGLDWKAKVFVSTDEIYAKKFGVDKNTALKNISICTFDNPPQF